jgi:hypothetical protein
MLSWFGGKPPSDDISLLRVAFRPCYEAPHAVLDVEYDASVTELRNCFRELCVQYCHYFIGQKSSKYTWEQILFSYHLARGNLSGPTETLAQKMASSSLMQLTPEGILPQLRPFRSKGIDCHPYYRGCAMFAIEYEDYETSFDDENSTMPHTSYIFTVFYCMRKYQVRKRYSDFVALHREFQKELLLLPSFPEAEIAHKMLMGSRLERGTQLAHYVQRIHDSLASRALFSPRLMDFLNIDFRRVHSEEEGQLLLLLDSTQLPPKSVWHIVDENWLRKWRLFMMGRGPRRYFPPGRVTNESLLLNPTNVRSRPKDGLELGVQYRAVNFNVWTLIWRAYSGLSIPRKGKDIYTDRGLGEADAIVRVQSCVRKFISRCKYDHLKVKVYSQSNVVAREMLLQFQMEERERRAKELIQRIQEERRMKRLFKGVQFTQRVWRRKHNLMNEEGLLNAKLIQEVFARAEGKLEGKIGDEKLVVEEQVPIINLGSTSTYEVLFREGDRSLKELRFRQKPRSEDAVVSHIPAFDEDRNVYAGKKQEEEEDEKARDQEDEESKAVFDASYDPTRTPVVLGSKVIAINDVSTATLSYEDIMHRIAESGGNDLKFTLSYPRGYQNPSELHGGESKQQAQEKKRYEVITAPSSADRSKLFSMSFGELQDIQNEDLRYQMFKQKLAEGFEIIKHSKKGRGRHDTKIRIDDNYFYYYSGPLERMDDEDADDFWKHYSLYDIKYIEVGKTTKGLKKFGVNENLCFSLMTEGRPMDFELHRDTTHAEQSCRMLVWGLERLLDEIQASQWFVNKEGIPTRRRNAKKVLRTL